MKSSISPSFSIESIYPRVTFAMLADYLDSLTILKKPSKISWKFAGFFVLPSETPIRYSVSEDEVLFVTRSREGEAMVDKYPDSFFIIVHDGTEPPSWADGYADRILWIKNDRAYSYILFMIQEFFMNVSFWFKHMDEIASGQGTLQDLLDYSTDILENYVVVSDNTNLVTAFTKRMSPPDVMTSNLKSRGYYSDNILKSLGMEEPLPSGSTRIATARSTKGGPIEICVMPIWSSGNYFGTFLMACNKHHLNEGLLDFARLFVNWMAKLCLRILKRDTEENNPDDMFFINILEEKNVNDDYILSRVSKLGLPENPVFRLAVGVLPSSNRENSSMSLVLASMRNLNNGKCIPFRYDGNAVCLIYTKSDDDYANLPIEKVEANFDEIVCEPFGVYAGVSQRFRDIRDLRVAYRQAHLACNYKEAIDFERATSRFKEQKYVYSFEDALFFYLIDTDVPKKASIETFDFSDSLLNMIEKQDKLTGSDDFGLLWVYLNCDCSVSSTAKRLFMHRNTVLYHIDKIKSKFAIDFNDKSIRESLIAQYKVRFLDESKKSKGR